jgi:DNA gyrase/topoisomerase IV subunit B
LIEFTRGILSVEEVIDLDEVSSYIDRIYGEHINVPADWSTIVIIKPDNKIFKSVKSGVDTVPLSLIKQLYPKCNVYLNNHSIEPLSIKTVFDKTEFLEDKVMSFSVDSQSTKWVISLGYSKNDLSESHKGSVNTLMTDEGLHSRLAIRGIGQALTRLYSSVVPGDVRLGLRIFTLVLCKDPEFTSQTKERLGGIPNIKEKDIQKDIEEESVKLIKANKQLFDAVHRRIIEYKREMGKLELKDYIESRIVRGGDDNRSSRGLGAKVYDCSTKNRREAELFVVEGKSAAGTVLQCRDVKYHACLPLRGKPINTSSKDIKTVLDNQEMRSMINVIGVGIDPVVDLSKSRYGKIIMLADADPDGKSINALLLGTIYTFIPQLIEAGMVYVSQVPLYKQGDKYVFTKDELIPGKPYVRFKGLGEMNASQLKDTAIGPSRKLLRVTLEDGARARALLVSTNSRARLMRDGGIIE